MRLDYDFDVNALYIGLAHPDAEVARTVEIDDNTGVDLAADGTVVGIEVISLAHPWPVADILARFPIPEAEERQLRAYFPVWTDDLASRFRAEDRPTMQPAPILSVEVLAAVA